MISYEKAFKKPFTDLSKLVIGIVLSVIPIVNWIPEGFAIESSGLGKAKASDKMPEWKDWGRLFTRGLLATVITLIYAIPGIIVVLIGIGIAIVSLVSTFAGAMTGMSQNWMSLLPVLITTAPLTLVGFILILIAAYISPMAILNYVRYNKFSSAFDFGAVLKKAFTGKYFMAWLITMVFGVILGTLLSFIPIVGMAAASFIASVISFSLFGQVFKEV